MPEDSILTHFSTHCLTLETWLLFKAPQIFLFLGYASQSKFSTFCPLFANTKIAEDQKIMRNGSLTFLDRTFLARAKLRGRDVGK